MDFAAVDAQVAALAACLTHTVPVTVDEPLFVGVDLGTAYIVVAVLNSRREPVACAMEYAEVIRDGVVVDYMGATHIVKKLVAEVGERLGRPLEHAATAVPPGTDKATGRVHQHVVEAAGLTVVDMPDEPTAANAVLQVQNGAIVDIGGGTTGLAVLKEGEVVYVADEATGGTHVSLVLAGSNRISVEEAEVMKKKPELQKEILPVVRPVLQKMASIIKRHIDGRDVEAVYLVGGTCCLDGMEKVIAEELGCTVLKPANPFLVTPLGIALHGGARS